MKLKLFLPILISCLLTLQACNKTDQTPINATLSVSTSSLVFAADDDQQRVITVSADKTQWDFSCSADWVLISRDDDSLLVSVSKNTSDSERSTSILITPSETGLQPQSVSVRQQAPDNNPDDNPDDPAENPVLQVSTQNLEFQDVNAEPQIITITVAGGVEWDARVENSADAEWIQLSSSANELTVSVLDNDNSVERNALITVFNANRNVACQPVQIQVSQAALVVPPSISISNLPDEDIIITHIDNRFEYNFQGDLDVVVHPYGTEWTVEVVSGGNWFNVLANLVQQRINIYIDNPPTDAADAEFIVKHSDPAVRPISVKVHKKPQVISQSTISDNLTVSSLTNVYAERTSWERESINVVEYSLVFYGDDVNYFPTGKDDKDVGIYYYSGSGSIVKFTFIEDKNHELGYSDYTVTTAENYKLPIGQRQPGWIKPGSKVRMIGGFNTPYKIYLYDTYYAKIDNNIFEDVEYAIFTEGSVDVSKDGNNYVVSWSLVSDNGYTVSGSYSGPIDFVQKVNPDSDSGSDGGVDSDATV